jgi:hypothetical protein
MLKAEKYKERIKELDYSFALCEGEMKDCESADCENCKFVSNSGCTTKKVKWLLEEYKEPILTKEEKGYLKSVIEPKKDDITWIRKWCFYKGTESEYTTVTVYAKHPALTSPNSFWVLLDFIVTEEMPFKGMELEKAYSLEELGI